MSPADDLIDQATDALVRLDADALAKLQTGALQLRALRVHAAYPEETMARFRVFADVLRGTRESLHVLRGLSAQGSERNA